MAIQRDEVRHIATLARLEVPEAELDDLARELSAVLEFAAALDRLDLTGLEPSVFAPRTVPLRDDVVDDRRVSTTAALASAPEAEGGFFLVPPVVENINP